MADFGQSVGGGGGIYEPAPFASTADTTHSRLFPRPTNHELATSKQPISQTAKSTVVKDIIFSDRKNQDSLDVLASSQYMRTFPNYYKRSSNNSSSRERVSKIRPAGKKKALGPQTNPIEHSTCSTSFLSTNDNQWKNFANTQSYKGGRGMESKIKVLGAKEMGRKMTTSKIHLGDHRMEGTTNDIFKKTRERIDVNRSGYAGVVRHKPNDYCIITGRQRRNEHLSQYENAAVRSNKASQNQASKKLGSTHVATPENGLSYRGYNILSHN